MTVKKFFLMMLSISFFAFGLGVQSVVHAQEKFPTRPIKIVVPFPPGGATDIIARVIGQKLSEQVGQAVVIDNKSGANGNIAADFVAKAPADGYTLLYNTSSITLSPALYKNLTYNVLTDFEPIILTSVVPLTIH